MSEKKSRLPPPISNRCIREHFVLQNYPFLSTLINPTWIKASPSHAFLFSLITKFKINGMILIHSSQHNQICKRFEVHTYRTEARASQRFWLLLFCFRVFHTSTGFESIWTGWRANYLSGASIHPQLLQACYSRPDLLPALTKQTSRRLPSFQGTLAYRTTFRVTS